MTVYMLDTDISYILMRSNEAVLCKLPTIPVSALCISAVVESELRFVVETSPRCPKDQDALETLLAYLQVLDYPAEAASDYGRIQADLKRRGVMIGCNDLFIAAHARCLGLTLVTNNTREFARVPGLKVENWT